MSLILQVLEISEIWICHIFEFFWMPKFISTLSKRLTEHVGDSNNKKIYVRIIENFYVIVTAIIR